MLHPWTNLGRNNTVEVIPVHPADTALKWVARDAKPSRNRLVGYIIVNLNAMLYFFMSNTTTPLTTGPSTNNNTALNSCHPTLRSLPSQPKINMTA